MFLWMNAHRLIEYLPLQQGLRLDVIKLHHDIIFLIEYLPLQQGLRLLTLLGNFETVHSLSIFHYNKD